MTHDKLGPRQRISRKEASLRQIQTAIGLFVDENFACTITLALAAEDQLPETNDPHLWRQIMARALEEASEFNMVRNWLKHYKEPEEIDLFEFQVAISIARAATKFVAVHHQATVEMNDFSTGGEITMDGLANHNRLFRRQVYSCPGGAVWRQFADGP